MSNSSTPTSAKSRRLGNFNLYFTVILGVFILGGVNYLGFKHYWRKDFSLNKYFELSPKSIEVLKSLKEPVSITTFFLQSPIQPQVDGLIQEYQFRGGDKIKVEKVDVAQNPERAEELAKKFKFTGQENLVIFEYQDRSKYVSEKDLAEFDMGNPMMGGGGPKKVRAFKGEQQFTSAIQTLIEGKASKIYFTTGHGERDLSDTAASGIADLQTRIKGSNLDPHPLNLSQTGEVPTDADAVVIAGPRQPFNAVEVQAIAKYLAEKGKVMLFQDPTIVSGLEPILEQHGMKLQNNVIISKSMINLGGMVAATQDKIAIAETYADHPTVNFLKGYNFAIYGARSLQVLDQADPSVKSKVTSLVQTGAESWGETNFTEKKVAFDAATDLKGPLTVVAVYDGGEVPGEGVNVAGTRLVVVGSSLFMINRYLEGTSVDFITNALNWMTKKETVLGINPKIPQEYSLNLSPLQTRSVTGMALLVVPGVWLVIGILIWYRRRR